MIFKDERFYPIVQKNSFALIRTEDSMIIGSMTSNYLAMVKVNSLMEAVTDFHLFEKFIQFIIDSIIFTYIPGYNFALRIDNNFCWKPSHIIFKNIIHVIST